MNEHRSLNIIVPAKDPRTFLKCRSSLLLVGNEDTEFLNASTCDANVAGLRLYAAK